MNLLLDLICKLACLDGGWRRRLGGLSHFKHAFAGHVLMRGHGGTAALFKDGVVLEVFGELDLFLGRGHGEQP